MKITGALGEYECKWKTRGYSWAEVIIYKKVKVKNGWLASLFGEKEREELKQVWTSNGRDFASKSFADTALPEELRRWFKKHVDEYEKYETAWSKEVNAEVSEVAEKNQNSGGRIKTGLNIGFYL